MYGETINKVLFSDPFASKSFGGVLSLSENNQWQKPLKLPVSYVINTDRRKSGKGEHWVGVYCDKAGACEYFDSYGTPPLSEIYNWLKSFCPGVVLYNTKWIQSPLSRVCGGYVVLFLLMRSRGVRMETMTKMFQNEKNFLGNDLLLVEMLTGDGE